MRRNTHKAASTLRAETFRAAIEALVAARLLLDAGPLRGAVPAPLYAGALASALPGAAVTSAS